MKRFYLLLPMLCLGLWATGQNTYSVTLEINFADYVKDGNDNPDTVFVAGSFQEEIGASGDWTAGETLLTKGTGADSTKFSITIPNFPEGTFEYKFGIGTDWGMDEGQLSGPCTQNTNRVLTVAKDTSVAYCWKTCFECGVTFDVTFEVDLTEKILGGEKVPDTVFIAGTFQPFIGLEGEWQAGKTLLTQDADNDSLWRVTLALPPGGYEYKFGLGSDWGNNEDGITGDCAANGNRFINVEGDASVSYCYNTCFACGFEPPKVKLTLRVDMTNQQILVGEPQGGIVSVAGAFQGWSPGSTVMTDEDDDGIFEVTVEVDANSSSEYKFLFGDDWGTDEAVPGDCSVNSNRQFTVADQDTILPVVCYGSCEESCPDLGTPRNITFLVDLGGDFPSGEGVHLAGTLQTPSWRKDAWKMVDPDGNNIFSIVVEGVRNGEYEWKFFNGIDDTQTEGLKDDPDNKIQACGKENFEGNFNRTLKIVSSTPDTVIALNYNTCDAITKDITEDIANASTVTTESGSVTSVFNTPGLEIEYRLFPNPFSNSTRLQFDNPDAKAFDLIISDLSGRSLRQITNIRADQVDIQRGNLASGIYFATLRERASGAQLTLKLIVR